jgi:NADH-quinone oxidoreductase subunit J
LDLTALASLINPALLYGACALGAIGVCMALPRGGRTPQVIGAIVAALAGALVLLGLGTRSASLPNIYFYIFSVIALGAGLRVITHPRPVYAALYFIMTVLASAGLFLILSAEFMAFALVIVYAGAILITYLFVIMLATQAPTEDQLEVLSEYDTFSREPLAATAVGFVFLAVLTTMLFSGTPALKAPAPGAPDALLADMPRRVEAVLHESGRLKAGESVLSVNAAERKASVGAPGATRTVDLPADLTVKNVEGIGFTLLRDHPGSIEIAGVILLMAMLGAVVLSRRQVQIDEDAKLRHAQRLARDSGGAA